MTLTEKNHAWTPRFVDAILPSYSFINKEILRKKLSETVIKQIQLGSPRVRGLLNYISKVYDCKPSVDELDKIITKNIHGDFKKYLESVMDREKISHVVLDLSRLTDRPISAIG